MVQNETSSSDRFSGFVQRARKRAQQEITEPYTDETLALGLLMRRVTRLMMADADTEILKPSGLTWAAFRVCFSLWVDGDLQPHEAATLASMSRASVTATVKTLTKAELVTTTPSTTDRRSIVLSLTPKGQELVREVHGKHLALIDEWLAPLQVPEKHLLMGLLGKIMLGPRADPFGVGHAINS